MGDREAPLGAVATGCLVYLLALALFLAAFLVAKRSEGSLLLLVGAGIHLVAATAFAREHRAARTICGVTGTVWGGLAIAVYGALIQEGLPVRTMELVWLGVGAALAAALLFAAAAQAPRCPSP